MVKRLESHLFPRYAFQWALLRAIRANWIVGYIRSILHVSVSKGPTMCPVSSTITILGFALFYVFLTARNHS